MSEFELTLGGIKYTCGSNQQSKDHQNWTVSAKMHGLDVHIRIPLEKELPRAKVLLFIEAFHQAMLSAVVAQDINKDRL